MIEPPEIVQTTPMDYAFIHLHVRRTEMSEQFGPAVQELIAALASQGTPPAGPVFAHHFSMDDEHFEFELGCPVPAPITPTGRIENGHRPAQTVARTTLQGDYERLPGAWGEFQQWIEAQGVRQAPDIWETYTVGPETSQDPANWRTVLERPLF